MRIPSLPRLALIAALILAGGCSSNHGKIEGIWVSTAATVKGENLPAGARVLHFQKDGHLLYTVAAKPYKGSFALGMGPAVTFTMEDDLDGRKIHAHKVVIDGNQLTLTSADGSEMAFHKFGPPG